MFDMAKRRLNMPLRSEYPFFIGMTPELAKQFGLGASMPDAGSLDVQANRDSSENCPIISIWSRWNAPGSSLAVQQRHSDIK